MTNRQIIRDSLTMWRNHIQTGNVVTSVRDVVNMGEPEKVRMLSREQQEFVIRIEELAEEFI
jgi:hypothetical protein